MSVWTLAESRAELPDFPGTTLTEKLYNGQREASSRLSKYVGSLVYDADQAEAVLHEVQTWVDRRRPDLEQALADPGSAQLPENVALELGIEKARQFIVAAYSVATRTLGPWISGAVYDAVIAGELNQPDMERDALSRLSIFASIVKWDDDGDLFTIFSQPQASSGVSGLPPVVVGGIIVAVLIVAVIAAAQLINAVSSLEVVRRNADIFDKMCKEAQAKGDSNTTQRCIEMATSVQKTALEKGDTVGTIAKWAAVVALGYLAGRYVLLPVLSKKGYA